jgi:Mg-chelatase subunit ChlD
MNYKQRLSAQHKLLRRQRKGAMVILVLLVLVLLIVGALFSIDVAYMHMIRAELRTATDAAARAGAETLSRTQDPNQAINAAIEIAQKNNVAGNGLDLRPSDIELGSHKAVNGRFVFVPGGTQLNAVRVRGTRLADSLDGSVPLFFGRMFGTADFQPLQQASATKIDRDIALVLDRSGSMASQNRFTELQNAVNVFLFELSQTSQDEYVSLTFYNEFPKKMVDLTPDHLAISNALKTVSPSGFTGIGRGLIMGSDSLLKDPLQRPLAQKSIVLMTDGIHNRGIDPLTAADTAVARGQVVHTITFSSGADKVAMKAVADKTGGIYFHADNEKELRKAFQDIALEVPLILIE